MSDLEYFIKLLGAILFAAGLYLLCLYFRDFVYDEPEPEVQEGQGGGIKHTQIFSSPAVPKAPPPPSPRTPADEEDPRLEAIRRWQSQGVLNDDGELWWVSAAKAKRRNPADDVNPPRIPPKRGRM